MQASEKEKSTPVRKRKQAPNGQNADSDFLSPDEHL
jgi:hypothetical protein